MTYLNKASAISRTRRSANARMLAAVIAATVPALGWASDKPSNFPQRNVKLVSPFAAGGATDVLARLLGNHLGQLWKQSVIIENKPGGGGVIAATSVVRSPADGYTLLLGSVGPIEVLPSLIKDLPYNSQKDLAPIAILVNVENVLVVNEATPAKSVGDLIALAKKEPGKLNFASSGIGSTAHLAGEVFKQQAGIQITHVPYRGGAPAANALLAGEVEMSFASVPSVVGILKGGNNRLRALAVTGLKPLDALPNVPPLHTQGLPDFKVNSWYGLLAPKGTPPEIVRKINADVQFILGLPEVKSALLAQGWTTVKGTPEQMAKQIAEGIRDWGVVLKNSGIKAE